MKPFQTELDQAGVQYKPLIFSCYGRPHADSKKVISSLARRIARRSGKEESHVVERRLFTNVNLEIWRRSAKMIMACLPETAAEEAMQAEPADADLSKHRGNPGTVDSEPYLSSANTG